VKAGGTFVLVKPFEVIISVKGGTIFLTSTNNVLGGGLLSFIHSKIPHAMDYLRMQLNTVFSSFTMISTTAVPCSLKETERDQVLK